MPTAKAREVLPAQYPRPDVVSCLALLQCGIAKSVANLLQTFNLQRIALLPVALGQSPPDPQLIYLAMQDKLHQPYRQTLIPGLTEIVESMTPATQPGLLGVCLSGAGPTILALATSNFEEIAERIIAQFRENKIVCNWKLLEPADGTTVTRA